MLRVTSYKFVAVEVKTKGTRAVSPVFFYSIRYHYIYSNIVGIYIPTMLLYISRVSHHIYSDDVFQPFLLDFFL